VPLAFYVYYRVDPMAVGEARARVDKLFDRLQQRCGVRGRLLTKRDEPNLWMEAYEGVDDGALFEAALRTEAASLDLEAVLLPGDRRNLEAFVE
jgi:Domain of unknown function (DUF4936)